MWEVPLLAVISELAHRYRSPEMGVEQAVASLENKLAAFSTLTEGLDMSRFRLMDFGTVAVSRATFRRPSLNVCSRSRGSWAPVTTIWPSPQPDANGHPGARVVPGASANQP
jgi:hypothetical protein